MANNSSASHEGSTSNINISKITSMNSLLLDRATTTHHNNLKSHYKKDLFDHKQGMFSSAELTNNYVDYMLRSGGADDM